jgi:predicted metal-binding membrane protein
VSTAALERTASPVARRPARWGWDRGILVSVLLGATLLAWRQLAHMQGRPHAHAPFLLRVLLWSDMTVAMMLPAASPMIVTFAAVSGRKGGSAALRTALFVSAYLAVWWVASGGGALAQAALEAVAGGAREGVPSGRLLFAVALLGAGVWQLTPLKHACLRRCRTPLGFLIVEWRPGARGALVLGARHGTECVLCCWALMAVMLGVGTMSLAAMVVLTALMVAEKVAPGGHHIGRAAAVILFAWGGWQLVRLA